MRLLRALIQRLHPDAGITGVETAVVIGGLVLASSLVAGVVLNSGRSGSQRLDSVVQSALRQATTGMQLDGPVIIRTDGRQASGVLIDVTTSAGGGSVPLDAGGAGPPSAAGSGLLVSALGSDAVVRGLPVTVRWLAGDGDGMLEPGELAELDVDVRGVTPPIAAGERFTLELRAGDLPPLEVTRTLPAGRPLDAVVLTD
ncbi:MAG: flagellin [Dehalococcoidia bacterium]|nr:flagellin [Dehalococcoidia bacterium]